jgi:hypothetical protein
LSKFLIAVEKYWILSPFNTAQVWKKQSLKSLIAVNKLNHPMRWVVRLIGHISEPNTGKKKPLAVASG